MNGWKSCQDGMRSRSPSPPHGYGQPTRGGEPRRAILAAPSHAERNLAGALRGRATERARIGGRGGPDRPGRGGRGAGTRKAPHDGAFGGGRSRTRTWDLFLIREAL